MRRFLRIGAGFLLALVIVTCTDKDVTGPRGHGVAALNLSAFQPEATPGSPQLPLDSLRISLLRIPGLTSAFDTVFSLHADTTDSLVVDLNVVLLESPEKFQLTIQAYGGGTVWYQASDTTIITSGETASPRLLATYVGPGAHATGVTMGPRDTTVTGGQAVALRVVVDSAGTPIANVPVGFSSGDTTKGKVTQPTLITGSFLGKNNIRDSVWLYVVTPTHLRDSTRIHIVPPPSQIVKISGDSQTVIVNVAAPAQLAVRVEDALNGGSPGVPVTWSVTQGAAGLAPASPVVSDTGGYARVTVTPSSLGTVKVQAAAAGLTGSPVTFTVNVLAGTVRQVIVAPKVDTIAKGATAQFTATLKDSLGNVITTVKPVWTSSNVAVATVDSTGLATALAGDSTYIVAAAGGYADTARLFVRAPAKVAVSPSDTVITAIGDSVHLTGVVLTNFGDTVKTGTVIRFASTAPGVVAVNAVTGEAQLIGAGNGVVQATDTVSKVTGTATLRGNQKVNGIVNQPPDSIEVGVNGQAQIIATAVDRNGHPIPGKTFGWVSRVPTIATVNQSGVVTGLAVGAKTYAVDTLVDSISVFRDSTLVSVVASPPPVLQWAFDTLAIGNGGNTTVTVSLNVPSAAGTVLQIVSGDTTRVKPTQTRIAVGTGGASASVTLQGLAATLTPVNVVAQDSAGIYKPDTLRVVVVSTLYFASVGQTTRNQDFYINQNETLNAQVFLSDPAPAGGLGVTFAFGKGYTAIAPTTVIIPQGQLAANVQFSGLTVGTDSVTPTSGAFAGKFSYLHVAKDTLVTGPPYPGTGVVGLGQWEQPTVSITYGMDHILPFTVAVTPSNLATVQTPDTFPLNTGGRSFQVIGTTLGSGTVTVSANNWLSGSLPLIVSTPKLGASGTTSIIAGAPASAGYWQVYTEDSLGYSHPVSAPVHVTAVSRDTTVVQVLIDTLTVPLNGGSNSVGSSLYAQPGAGGDSTYVVLSAAGYRSDSILVHVTKPTLTNGYGYPGYGLVGFHQQFVNAGYVAIPYARPDSFWVVLSHTRKGVVSGPDSVVIPKGQTSGYFNIAGDTLNGVDTVTITRATGYVVAAAPNFVYTVDSLHVRAYVNQSTLYTISQPTTIYAAVYEASTGQSRNLIAPLPVTISLSRPNVVTLDSATITIPAGSYYSANDTMRVAGGVAAPDSTRILTTSAAPSQPDSVNLIHVLATPLNISLSPSYVGRGLKSYGNYVYLPAAAPNTLSVALARTVPGKDTLLPLSVTIPKGQTSSSQFQIWGKDSTTSDTITATATGFVTGKATVFLTRDTLRMSKPGASQITTAPPYRLYTYLYNAVGYNENPWAPVSITFTSSNPTVITIDSGATLPNPTLDTMTALVDTAHSYGVIRINFVGPGTAYVKATAPGFGADSFAVTVTGPTLSLSSSTITVGTQQFIVEYATVQNPPASPVTVTLQRSDSTALPGSQVFTFSPATVTIAAGQYQSNADTLVGANIGVAQLIARATGYGAGTATIQVGKPQISAPTQVNLWAGATAYQTSAYTLDQAGSYRQVAQATPVTATITDPTVASVDSAQRTVPFGGNSTSAYRFLPLKKGAVQAIFSATGYKSDTMVIVVDTGTLSTYGPGVLGVGQTFPSTVSIPYTTVAPVTVTLQSSNPSALTVPASVVIPANQSSVNYTMTAVGLGSATVTASAPGVEHPSTPVGVVVSTPHLVVSTGGSANAGQQDFFTVYAEDSIGGAHAVAAPVTVHLSASPAGHSIFAADSVIIGAGNSSVSSTVTFDTATGFTITASATGYASGTSGAITVSGVEIKVGVANGLTFTPGTDTVAVNHYATWVWDSTNTNSHGVHWLTAPGSLPGDSPTQSSGSYQVYFTTPGTYTYQCTVHGAAMQGTIVVQ